MEALKEELGILQPTVNGWSGHIGDGLGRNHPAFAPISALLLSYAALVVAAIGFGFLVTHVLVHSGIGHWDVRAAHRVTQHRTGSWNAISGYFTHLADTLGILIVALVVTVLLAIRKAGRSTSLLFLGLAVELAVFLSTTYLVGRVRPGVSHIGGTPSTYSWPSGHVAATFVLYGGIAVLVMSITRHLLPRIAAWIVAIGLTILVAVSRVYRGEHYPSDVLAGFLVGAGALATAVFVIRTWGASVARDSLKAMR